MHQHSKSGFFALLWGVMRHTMRLALLPLCALLALGGCRSADGPQNRSTTDVNPAAARETVKWAIALHGGAGTIDRDSPPELVARHQASLTAALDRAVALLQGGSSAMDVAEQVVRMLEDDELFNAGKGAALTARGEAELDAAIMDGATLRCGAVAGVRTVKNPISIARLVMQKSKFILLSGGGAEEFADTFRGQPNIERVPNSYFITPRRQKMLREYLAEQADASSIISGSLPARFGTVGCVVMDSAGNLAAATSTGGLTGKQFGRIGDAPLIGAGTYATNASAAVSCTGTGEQFIRHGVAKALTMRMELLGEPAAVAAAHIVGRVLAPDDGGLIAVSKSGEIAMAYNSAGMFRAAADSSGWRLVRIWDTK